MAFGDWMKPAGAGKSVSATFTRPNDTTAYASGDLVANSTTAGSVAPLVWVVGAGQGRAFSLEGVTLKKSGTGVTNAAFRLHLYQATQTVTNGDNGAVVPSDGDSYLGSVDVTVDRVFGDGAAGVGQPANPLLLVPADGSVYGLLEARGAYTPAAQEVFVAVLHGVQR